MTVVTILIDFFSRDAAYHSSSIRITGSGLCSFQQQTIAQLVAVMPAELDRIYLMLQRITGAAVLGYIATHKAVDASVGPLDGFHFPGPTSPASSPLREDLFANYLS